MKKKFIDFKEISEKLQEKIDKNADYIKPEEYMYFCSLECQTISEFYKKLVENPKYKLLELEGSFQGIECNGKSYLFKDYIPKQHELLIWNQLSLDSEQDIEQER